MLFSQPSIVIQVKENVHEIGRSAAQKIVDEIEQAKREGKQLALILPTGSTPEEMYQQLVKLFYEGKIDFSTTRFYNLDEYVGLSQDDPKSYSYYMNDHLYKLITSGLCIQKLKYWGLKPLSKKDCFNSRTRTRLNKAIERLYASITAEDGDNLTSLEAFDSAIGTLKKEDRVFQKLYAEYMNDKALPSVQSLRAWIEKDSSLKALTASRKNIHLIDGLATDLTQEAEAYHKAIKASLDHPEVKVICIAGIGEKPEHIAFNDFILEDKFLSQNLSEVEKNALAIKTQTRIVPLSEETRMTNARFFSNNSSKVPKHALTVGFNEILECDKIIILANGSHKQKALFNTFAHSPSYQVPASLLKSNSRAELLFLIDENAFGLGETNSLFSLNALGKLKQSQQPIYCDTTSTKKIPIWSLPYQKMPVLLDKGYKMAHHKVTLASLPKNQSILWIKQNKIHYSLWQELKENKNKIHVTRKQNVDELLSLIDKHQIDMIVMPHTYELVENFSDLKCEVLKRFPNKPILAAFYDVGPQLSNVFFPMNKEEHKNKVRAVRSFHHTQVSRTKFDLIAEEMNLVPSKLSPFNETYSFFNIEFAKKALKLTPFKQKTYICKDQQGKKKERLNLFSFKENDMVLIASPHPDDAEISMGGLIQFLGKENVQTCVFNATSGHNAIIKKSHALAHPYLPNDVLDQITHESSEFINSKTLKARIRECESLGALSFLNPSISVQLLRLPFYERKDKKFEKIDRQIIDDAITRAAQAKDGRIFFFLPYPQDRQGTHRAVHAIFMERITHFCMQNKDKEAILAFYPTPWTGEWNLYDYSYNQGSKLAALCGSELLVGSGESAASPESLGGIFANRYLLFYLNDQN